MKKGVVHLKEVEELAVALIHILARTPKKGTS